MENREPVFYVLMRKDIPDLSPGKMAAQACHAQANFIHYAKSMEDDQIFNTAYLSWCDQGKNIEGSFTLSPQNNFGTTIVLEVTEAEIDDILDTEKYPDHDNIFSVVDYTYPFRNYYGELFTVGEVTCYWMFAYLPEHFELVKNFPLHR